MPGSWFRDGLVVWKPVKAVLFNYGNVFFWIKGKLGLSEYQMAALAWLKGLILGFLLAYFLF
ncbi:hypothetical protein SynRS9915_01369 [Synechococcus sp. RS9915]|nr:hypothetical protein SynRS9915_01369 [Synechococcus sp. RS9915]